MKSIIEWPWHYWLIIALLIAAVIRLTDGPPVYHAENIHQVRHLSRHCTVDLGGRASVETQWEKTSPTTRKPAGWEITCHEK